jgi:hypothetical protein
MNDLVMAAAMLPNARLLHQPAPVREPERLRAARQIALDARRRSRRARRGA